MKKVLLSETLHITRNATRFLLLVLTLLHSTIREIRGEERNHIHQDETIMSHLSFWAALRADEQEQMLILGAYRQMRSRLSSSLCQKP